MAYHPFFASPLEWHDTLESAQLAARVKNAVILAVHGHRLCGGTRAMIEKTLRKEEIVEFIGDRVVVLASDSDTPPPWVTALMPALPKQGPTPLCLYLHFDGRLLMSTAGGRPPAVLLNDLMQALAAADKVAP